MKALFSRNNVVNIAKILAMVAIVLIGNRLIQTYLGKQSVEQMGIEPIELNEALALAERSNKLVLADMSAIWCPTCRKLDNSVFSDPSVHDEINKSFIFSRIEYDSEQGEEFMKKYKVRGFPTLLILNDKGEKITRLPLTFDPAEFKQMLIDVKQSYMKPATTS